MNNCLLRAAIVAALAGTASTAANAAAYTIHASGASAQRTFWESDLEAIATGTYASTTDAGGTTVCTIIKTTAALNPPVPDLHSLTCTISASRGATPPALPAGLNAGDSVTLNYEAEFGSVWGIAPFIDASNPPATNASTIGRRSVTCAGVTGYSRDHDTATACLSAPSGIDLAVSDVEPIFWALPDNWSASDGLSNAPDGTGFNNVINILSIPGQGQPTLAQLQTLESGWTEINGEVFTVVVNSTAAPTNGITNLSTQSLRSIFTGAYKTWAQVPEVGTGGSIVVCRRDHGSGTQVESSLYFTQTECGGNNGSTYLGGASGGAPRFVSTPQSLAGAAEGNLDQTIAAFDGLSFQVNPIENFSSNDIKACLAAYPGVSIGILALSPGSGYTTISIDNTPANAHNAALGAYPYWSTTWGFNNTPSNQPSNTVAQAIASTLVLDAQRPSRGVLPKEGGTYTGGVWTATTPVVAFGVNDLLPLPTVAANTANPSAPTSVYKNQTKSACTIPVNTL
jgi:hypothetical protein